MSWSLLSMYQQIQLWLNLFYHALFKLLEGSKEEKPRNNIVNQFCTLLYKHNCANVIPIPEKYNSDYVYPHSSVDSILLWCWRLGIVPDLLAVPRFSINAGRKSILSCFKHKLVAGCSTNTSWLWDFRLFQSLTSPQCNTKNLARLLIGLFQ